MVSCLEEGLFDVKNAVNVQNWHKVDSVVRKEVNVELVVVNYSVKKLEDDIKWHLDRNSFTSMMSSCYEHGRLGLEVIMSH